jgi:hypothetical protein
METQNTSETQHSSPNPLAHWHDVEAGYHTHVTEIIDTAQVAIAELRHDIQVAEMQVGKSLHEIASELGIYDFSHHLGTKNFEGCTFALHPNNHLEIRRPGVAQSTIFPVIRREAEFA